MFRKKSEDLTPGSETSEPSTPTSEEDSTLSLSSSAASSPSRSPEPMLSEAKTGELKLEDLRKRIIGKLWKPLGSVSLQERVAREDAIRVFASLSSLLQGPPEKLSEGLIRFLSDRWDAIRGTYLGYTSVPDSEVTKICCAIAEYLAVDRSDGRKPFQFLMPTIKFTMDLINREDLVDSEMSLEKMLRLHICSDDGKSLIPIALLINVSLGNDLQEVMLNPFVFSKEPHLMPLSDRERYCLHDHSGFTRAILGHREDFIAASETVASLYLAMKKLARGLKAGSVHGTDAGVTEEGNAGTAAYKAIREFNLFWEGLSPEDQANVLNLPQVGGKLSETVLNDHFGGSVCAYMLSLEINVLADNHREVLLSFMTEKTKKNNPELEQHRQAFEKAVAQLKRVHDSDKEAAIYAGREPLFLSQEQIASVLGQIPVREYERLLTETTLSNKERHLLLTMKTDNEAKAATGTDKGDAKQESTIGLERYTVFSPKKGPVENTPVNLSEPKHGGK